MEEKAGGLIEVMISGVGGQGSLLFGRLLAEAGMEKYKNVLFFPNYGALMRGGESECTVILTDGEATSPIVLEPPVAVVMSAMSLRRFQDRVKSGGMLFLDDSAVHEKVARDDLEVFYIPATEMAAKIGDNRAANFICLGAYLEATKAVPVELVHKAIDRRLAGKRETLLAMNKKALEQGQRWMQKHKGSQS